jgi:hypothetical protein
MNATRASRAGLYVVSKIGSLVRGNSEKNEAVSLQHFVISTINTAERERQRQRKCWQSPSIVVFQSIITPPMDPSLSPTQYGRLALVSTRPLLQFVSSLIGKGHIMFYDH